MFFLITCTSKPASVTPEQPESQPTEPIPPTQEPIHPTALPQPTASPSQALEPSAPDIQTQYRIWMEEARTAHPYTESVEHMWNVMICESSGNPEVVAGSYYGLFQYSSDTWGGEWNPYRDQPILDAHAQIFATAKAWQDGHQTWWGCY